jgi:RNA polymerase sigma-70 factor (family 1)
LTDHQNNNEALLLKQVSEGDETAFNTLFARYRNQLFAYLLAITKSKETAEEIVLDVFMKLWLGRELAKEIKNLKSFLYRVAHNKAIDFLRLASRSPVLQSELWTAIHSSQTAHELLDRHRAEDVLDNAVKALSPMRRKVFQLSRDEELSFDEIAGRLNLSRNTVRNHVATSLEFIRNYLQERGYDLPAVAVLLAAKGLAVVPT